jgi:hemoglobin/transferrin/lactoferrin receptor protein
MRKLIACALGLYGFMLHAQEIYIKDQTTLKALEQVTIINVASQAALTSDQNGMVDITTFRNADSLIFKMLGYEDLFLSYEEAIQLKTILLTSSPFSLEGIIISANRWEQNKTEVPNHITSIEAKDIAFYNPQTSADMLAQSGQVFVQKSQFGGGSPMIRGFATNRLLMVVDGVRMNTAIFRSGNIQNVISIDPNALEGAEIIFGPGSLIYGSDALGGVMDFHTLTPELSNTEKTIVEGSVFGRFASANIEKTGHADINIGTKKWAFLTSVSFSDFDDLMMGSNGPDEYLRPESVEVINGVDSIIPNEDPQKQLHTDMSYYNIMQKIRFKPNANWDLNYGFHYSKTSEYDRYDRLIEYRDGAPRSAVWNYGPQIWNMHVISLQHNAKSKLYDIARITLAYQFFEESRIDRSYQKTTQRTKLEQVDAISANLDLQKSINKTTLFYGLEGIHNGVTSLGTDLDIETGIDENASSRYPDGATWQSFAAYLSSKTKLKENFTLQAGLRYNRVILNADFDTTFFPFPFTSVNINSGALTGSAGFAWLPAKDLQINFNLSTGFRAPNVDDIGKVFDSEPGNVTVPNPDLLPEYAYNIDLGFIKGFGDIVEIQITGFYTLLSNAIVRRSFNLNGEDSIIYAGELSGVQALQNIDKAFVYGIESGLRIHPFKNVTLASYLTFTHGEEQAEETGDEYVPLRHAPPLFGSTHISYQMKKFRADLYADYNAEVPFEELAPSEADKPHLYAVDDNGNPYCPAWYTLNLKLGYQIISNLNIQAGIDNITDVRYRPYSSGVVAPGRSIIVALRATF